MRNKIILSLIFTLLAVQLASATDIGVGIGININTEEFAPLIFMCDNRLLTDDNTQNGANGLTLSERKHNYAFEGEQISWKVLVLDKNKIEQISDVVTTVGQSTGGSGQNTTIVTRHTQKFCDSLTPQSGTWTRNLSLPKFNSNLGTLIGASIDFNDSFTANLSFEHTSAQGSAPYSANLTGNIIINVPEGSPLQSLIAFNDSGLVGPFDGVNDFGGTSGKKFENISNSGSHHFIGSNMALYASNIPADLDIPVSATSTHEVTGPGDFDTSLKTSSYALACITYDYQTEVVIPGTDGESVEVECKRINSNSEYGIIDPSCNAKILEENITQFNPSIMAYYECKFTVETPSSMYGEYFIASEVIDSTGLVGVVDETEYWFLNPTLSLTIDGTLDFSDVRPGTNAYSSSLLIGNDADLGSGVMLDMFISGTDFYDPAASGAACPSTNQLALSNFRYYATNGAFSSLGQLETDIEGYTAIPHSTDISGAKRIIRWNSAVRGASPSSSVIEDDWNNGNVLSPGSEMALVFRLSLPEPCIGDFSEGQIFFYGEAI